MSEATPQAAGGTQAQDAGQAPGYLRLPWGDEFMTGHDKHGHRAARHGQAGGRIIRAATSEEPGELMNRAGQ
jgi:hypothetical protein